MIPYNPNLKQYSKDLRKNMTTEEVFSKAIKKLKFVQAAGGLVQNEENGKTYTAVHTLEREERIREIARIIGGDDITPLKLKMAEEMLFGGEGA